MQAECPTLGPQLARTIGDLAGLGGWACVRGDTAPCSCDAFESVERIPYNAIGTDLKVWKRASCWSLR